VVLIVFCSFWPTSGAIYVVAIFMLVTQECELWLMLGFSNEVAGFRNVAQDSVAG